MCEYGKKSEIQVQNNRVDFQIENNMYKYRANKKIKSRKRHPVKSGTPQFPTARESTVLAYSALIPTLKMQHRERQTEVMIHPLPACRQ